MLIRIDSNAPLAPPLPEPSDVSLEGASQGPFIAATAQEQPPTVIISEASPPNPRPKAILKIRQATKRRQKAKVVGDADGDMDIDW